MITSWVRPKQHLAVLIKAAFSRYEAGIEQAGIIKGAVPTTSLSPFAPGDVIAILAVGISRVPCCAKEALGGVARAGGEMPCLVPGHCRCCQHGKKNRGYAHQTKSRHVFLPRGLG
jgi:hypothetical protein